MDARVQAATRVLNLLGVAIKASALYPSAHPEKVRATASFFKALGAFTEIHGPLDVHIGKQTLSVDGVAIHLPSNTNLAYSFYSRKLVGFTIMPTVSQPAVERFVAIVGMERAELEAAGGVEHLLQETSISGIEVTQLVPPADAGMVVLGLNAFHGLLGRSRMSPQEREQTVDIIRAGPDQVAQLLQNVYTLSQEVLEDVTEDKRLQCVHEAVRSLDRIILDEPFEQQGPLYANLAEATQLLEESLHRRLARLMVTSAAEDTSMQVILEHLSSEHLAQTIMTASEERDPVEQATTLIRGGALDQKKAKKLMSFLGSLVSRHEKNSGTLKDGGWHEVQQLRPTSVDEAPGEFRFDKEQMAISDEELEQFLEEVRRIDNASSVQETVKTLVDVLDNTTDEKELKEVAETLLGSLPWLVDHREYVLFREICSRLKTIAAKADPTRAGVINGLLESLVAGPTLDTLLAALWDGRESPIEQEIQASLEVLADKLVGPLVDVLRAEPRAGMRAMICDVLVRIGQHHVDDLGSFANEAPWYLVRNIANILGRMRSPQGVSYITNLVHHQDSRVRAQTVDALASIATEEAQIRLASFLNDPELSIRLRALRSLDARGMASGLPALLAALAMRDPLNRQFAIRQPAIEAVTRLGAKEALPALKKLAGARLVFGRRGRELRRLARMAVAAIEEASSHE
jgi:hypothetical protein